MSSENEDRRSLDGSGKFDGASMKPKIYYSREFLLSLSNLDICKKLPSGFDDSLISEFEDGSIRVPDRPRIPGSLPQHGFRRNDYGSSPPMRVDSGSFSRGTGKWENRSSGRSDLDSDSLSDKDSDSGRHYGHPSRRSWRNPEHDGLLGSGSFPRPSGYTAGVSAPKVRANEHNQLSRSTEPYHPPRPYKAVPHSRRDTDAYNDETFGSIDSSHSTSKDRAEEERRRRASFEMMRKEQQKALHENQTLNGEKHRPSGDLFEGLEDSKEEKGLLIKNNGIAASAATSASDNDIERSFAAQSPPLRPRVPPGFKSITMEKSSGLKSQIQPPLAEVGSAWKSVSGEGLVDAEKPNQLSADDTVVRQQSQEISVVDGMPAEKPIYELLLNQGENVSMPGRLDVPIKIPSIDDQLVCLSNDIDSHTALDDSAITEISANVLGEQTASNRNSASILEKIFGSTLSLNDDQSSLGLIENVDNKPDDTRNQSSVQSSKFAQWFFEEDSKSPDDISSARPNNLMSLIASGDKGNEVSAQVCKNNKDDAFSTVLTCEDLEQTILSEFSAKATEVLPVLESGSNIIGTDNGLPTVHTDDHASLHLLSMLQKGPDLGNMPMNYCADTDLTDEGLVSKDQSMATTVNEHEVVNNSKSSSNLGNTLTLETLFGTAFMKELQSVEAPVSVQRGPVDSAREDASKPHGLAVTDNGFPFPVAEKSWVQMPNHDYSIPSNPRHHAMLSQIDNGVGFDDSSIGMTSPNHLPKAMPKHGGHDRFIGFQLPEEDLLISSSDTKDSQMSSFMQTGNSLNNANIRLDAPFNIAEKLGALGSVKDNWGMEGSDSRPLSRGSFEQVEPQILHHNLHVQQPSSLLQRPQMSHQSNPLYHHLEAQPGRMGSQMNFLHPEHTFSHDSLPNRQFPSNLIQPPFHHPGVRLPGYDVPPQHSLLHQMQMPGNHPLHMLADFPRGGPVPHHGSQPTGFIQEMNPMQGLPLGPRQTNIAGSRFPIPGNPPEALQRLIEMELRANSNQVHPLARGHSQGAYSHEVDMGFQYR